MEICVRKEVEVTLKMNEDEIKLLQGAVLYTIQHAPWVKSSLAILGDMNSKLIETIQEEL